MRIERGVRRRLAVAVLPLAVAAGCGDDSSSSTAAATGTEEAVEIGWFTVGPNSYMEGQFETARAVAERQNAKLTIVDPNFDATRQINQIQDAVTSKRFDAIVITPLNGVGVVPPVREAIAAGIPVIANEAPIGPRTDTAEPQVDGMAGSVMVPQDEFGRSIAELAAEACADRDPCEVAVENLNGSFAGDRAIEKAMDAIAEENPAFQVVTTVPTNNLRNEAFKATQDILQAHPGIDVIATSGDQVALGAELALKDMGKLGDVIVNGAGAGRPGVKRVREGTWFGTVLLVPGDQGRITMEMAVAAARGETIAEPTVNPVADAELPDNLTQDNVDELADFKAQWDG